MPASRMPSQRGIEVAATGDRLDGTRERDARIAGLAVGRHKDLLHASGVVGGRIVHPAAGRARRPSPLTPVTRASILRA